VQENMSLLFKKFISFLIIGEFLITGLGYCGHNHDHGPHHDEYTCDAMHLMECECDQHSPPHTHDHNKEDTNQKKCYCSCLGGFVADIFPVIYSVIHHLTFFEIEDLNQYQFRYIPFVYHPPLD